MKHLEDFVSPSRSESANFDLDEAKRIDQVNKEVHRRNRLVVAKAKAVLRAGAPNARTVADLEPPAIPVEYTRIVREQMEKDREAAAAYEERMMGAERGATR